MSVLRFQMRPAGARWADDAFLLVLVLAAMLILAAVWLWLPSSPAPAHLYWSHRLLHP